MNKLVSIIIPTYNRAYLIGETLESIIAQNYKNWECIIVDDGSTDNTAVLIAEYIKKDSRFQYHQRPVDRIKGANVCRNYGFELSKGKYVKWFDSDDIMHPDFLEKQVEVLDNNNNNNNLDFCASFSNTFSGSIDNIVAYNNPEVIICDRNTIENYIIGKIIFLTPSPLWNSSFLKEKKLFDESLINAHETDFNFRRLIEGGRFYYLTDIHFLVRRGHQSIDLNSINDPKSIKSMFVYYEKVYQYLCQFSVYLSNEQRLRLKKYIIYKQLMIFYSLRLLLKRKNSRFIFYTLLKNVKKSNFSGLNILRLLLGITTVYLFKKGYALLFIKQFRTI
ncbi:glycosyltransferase family 2 protein [Flavobacterium sp. Arc2]|uniref:glycosyltransferase family 2 protein n=1 Tax=Flavobacterium sp. Arc2 TaxID=3046685 RepID=UPI00352CF8D1